MTKIITEKIKGLNRHWRNYQDRDYLGSQNLEKGEELLLTIEKFEGEEMVQTQEGKQIKQVLYFAEDVPKLILNMTNGNTIARLYGNHPVDWIGKKIQLYPARVKAFGKEQDALRIRDFIPEMSVNVEGSISLLRQSTTLAGLKEVFSKLPKSAQNHAEVVAVKDELKVSLK